MCDRRSRRQWASPCRCRRNDPRAELLTFPAGKHDDQVDALGLIGQLLDRMIPGRVAKPEAPKHQTVPRYKPIEDLADVADWRTY